MRKLALTVLLWPLLALADPPTNPGQPLRYDANGNILPAAVNGHVLNLPAGTTIGGSAPGGGGITGGTSGNLIQATGATTIGDSGTALSSLATIPRSLSQFLGGSYAYRDVYQLASDEVDNRLVGQTAGTSSQNLFSTRNDTTPSYVRNASLFAHDVDFTSVSVWNSTGSLATATLISPRHVLLANHFFPTTGTTFRWVAADGTVVTRTLSSTAQIGSTDIRIGYLDSDAPATITPARVLSSTSEAKLVGAPIVYTDQNQELYVGVVSSVSASITGTTGINAAAGSGQRAGFWKTPVTGDSSHPIFTLVDGKAVLLGSFYSSFGVPSVAQNYAAINTAMTSLGGSYQLTPLSASVLANSALIPAAVMPAAGQIPLLDGTGKLDGSIIPSGIPATAVVQTITATSGTVTINNYTDFVLLAPSGGALTGNITCTLPGATYFPPSHRIIFLDPQRVVSSTYQLYVQRSGSDTINGGTAIVVLASGPGVTTATIATDGVNKLTADNIVRSNQQTIFSGTLAGGTVNPSAIKLPYNGTTLGSNAGSSALTLNWPGTNARTISFPDAAGTLMLGASNLSDLASAATARTNLGVTATGADTSYATAAQGVTSLSLTTPNVIFGTPVTFTNTSGAWAGTLPLNTQAANTFFGNGTSGTASPTFMSAATAKTALAITEGDVANLTTDLAAKAPLVSPTFTGTVTLPASTSLTTPNIGAATGTSLTLSSSETISLAIAANTKTDSLTTTNSGAATTGNQRYSPFTVEEGFGFASTGSASQSVKFHHGVVTVQGTSAPAGTWTLESSVGGGAYGNGLTVDTTGRVVINSGQDALKFGQAVPKITIGSSGWLMFTTGPGTGDFAAFNSNENALELVSNFRYGFQSGTNIASNSMDADMGRATAKVVSFNDGAATPLGGTWRSKATSPTQITADQNNYNPGGSSYYQRWSTDASRTITGLTFTAAQVDGQTHVMVNSGSFNIVLAHQSASSTSANRFYCPGAADLTVAPGQEVNFWDDATSGYWRVTKRGF